MEPLPWRAPIDDYDRQARALLEGWRRGDDRAIALVRHNHPRFLDDRIRWLPKDMSESELRAVPIELVDARLALARWYTFADWSHLADHVAAVSEDGSPVALFESAVEAVINGDAAALSEMLRDHPALVRTRSTRVTPHSPPVHAATLLHYVAANGVENYRQKSPKNAVEIARLLLAAGAEPDALAHMYGGDATTMSMLVSSTPPAAAGVQVGLVHVLIDFGAAVEPRGAGDWTSPLMTALAFGFGDAAAALVQRGARVETIAAAAGLGQLDEVRRHLPSASPPDRHRAFALAAQHGHVEVVRVLLDAGEDPSRHNPNGNHSHSTPLHQAVWAGHDRVVRLLVERGARLDLKDTIYKGTPLGWANYGGRKEIAAYLESQGAKDD
jgi:ankyrin repeat protein